MKTFGGANYEIIQAASLRCNFTFDLDAPAGKGTGSKLPDGTWTGLFADILYKKSDLAIVLARTRDRNGLVDFTTPFGTGNLVFATTLPTIRIKPDAVLYLFSPTVWLFVAMSFICASVAAYITLWCKNPNKLSAWRVLLLVFKIFMEQSNRIPEGLEFIVGLYLIYVIVIGTGYKCNLLASLSFPQADSIPTTFDELAVRADYDIYFDMSGTAGYNYFMQSSSSSNLVINIRNRFLKNLIRNDPARCVIAALLQTNTVCIGWDTVLNQVVGRNLTISRRMKPLYQPHEGITRIWVTIGLQKNSKYTKAFSFITSSFYETGLIAKWHEDVVDDCESLGIKWMKSQEGTELHRVLSRIAQSRTKGTSGLTLENVSVCFFILILGMILATGFFLYEIKLKQILSDSDRPVAVNLMLRVRQIRIWQVLDKHRQERKVLDLEATEPNSFDYTNYPLPEYTVWSHESKDTVE